MTCLAERVAGSSSCCYWRPFSGCLVIFLGRNWLIGRTVAQLCAGQPCGSGQGCTARKRGDVFVVYAPSVGPSNWPLSSRRKVRTLGRCNTPPSIHSCIWVAVSAGKAENQACNAPSMWKGWQQQMTLRKPPQHRQPKAYGRSFPWGSLPLSFRESTIN